MPLYEYQCTGCAERVELQHSMQETAHDKHCPHCGKPLRRQLHPKHHWWPANHRPGMEDSGQRMFLDPARQAKLKDELDQMRDEKKRREEVANGN